MQDNNIAPPRKRSIIGLFIVLLVGTAMAMAGSQGGLLAGSIPAFALTAIIAFVVQWLAFVPAYVTQSERYYDLMGSLTYLSVVAFAFSVNGDSRALLLATLVAVWAIRLGSFLFLRISDAGSDRRFDRIKPYFWPFLMTWSLQGLWVLMTAGAALAAMTSGKQVSLGAWAVAGLLVWVAGFSIEVIADRQKRAFRRNPQNAGRFISTGLWSWSRHPNYFGEIVLWSGVALIAFPALSGWQYATLVSPLFVYTLLTRVSGIPLLEAQARRRWGEDPEYLAYRAKTSRLLLWPPKA